MRKFILYGGLERERGRENGSFPVAEKLAKQAG